MVRSERNFRELLFPVCQIKFTRSASAGRTDHPRERLLCRLLQHSQFKHLFFHIDELQLQIQLLHLSCRCLLLLTVTGGKSKDSALTPETTQTHSHTPRPAWRIAEQRDPSTQDFECSMGDVRLLATFWTSINLALVYLPTCKSLWIKASAKCININLT